MCQERDVLGFRTRRSKMKQYYKLGNIFCVNKFIKPNKGKNTENASKLYACEVNFIMDYEGGRYVNFVILCHVLIK